MKKKFVCTSCRHVFSRNYKPELCPLCGEKTVEPYKPITAEDILNELE